MKTAVLSSGSRGNSVLIQTDNTKILIDLGVTKSFAEEKLKELEVDPSEIKAILITHTHVDHVQGLKVFLKKYHSKLYVNKIISEEKKLDSEGQSLCFMTHWCLLQKDGIYL